MPHSGLPPASATPEPASLAQPVADQPAEAADDRDPSAIVAVDTVASGLAAVSGFLEALPADSRLAVILVQHPGPATETLELLARHSKLPVRPGHRGTMLAPEPRGATDEEYHSAPDERRTSSQTLQSLNAELTARNSQLQEALEQQRSVSVALQNVLYSTDVATLFLDVDLNIRFFTPATRSLFNLIPSDVGRPLADLHGQAEDAALAADALAVLRGAPPIACEITKPDGSWFLRRIMPCRSHAGAAAGGVEGLVITFNDITERKRVGAALLAASRKAELASVAKSRFLAAANHDLRQPLQALKLLHGLLAKAVGGEPTRTAGGEPTRTAGGERVQILLGRIGEALGNMTGMLNALLDTNQIEAGVVKAEIVAFPIDALLHRLGQDFAVQAEARGLSLRVVHCGLTVASDPALLEQMLRNLMANAVKYTRTGKILLGCRRHAGHQGGRQGGQLSIQVLDSGVGIPADELQAIFDEYHQAENTTREHSPGMGLGLSIVQQLSGLLGHPVRVRSMPLRGSMFSIDVPLAPAPPPDLAPGVAPVPPESGADSAGLPRTGAILIIEDDPDLSDLLETFLVGEGHRVVSAVSGVVALEVLAHGAIRPDLVLTDFNLAGGLDGLGVARRLRDMLDPALPVVVLTGDIAPTTLRDVAAQNCVLLNKPVKLDQLTRVIQRLLPASGASAPHGTAADDGNDDASVIFVVDDDAAVRDAVCALLTHDGRKSRAYASCRAFLDDFRPAPGQCLLIDSYLPEIDGLALLRRLRGAGHGIPAVMMTGNSDVRMAVEAMQAGASDFIEKPIGGAELLASLQRALDEAQDGNKLSAWQEKAAARLATLTDRQREVMAMVLAGCPSKNIAADLHISQRTVENHRAAIMHKTGSLSLPALARLALAAAGTSTAPAGEPEAVRPALIR